jgi:tripartite-type tricarboxylate transporter receptor subunit TctC
VRLPRRNFLQLAAGAAAIAAAPRSAGAESYPSRPVRIIVGFPAGSASDVVARLTGQALAERLGQQFIVENHPGAGTNLAAEAVVHAAPDGYTLLLSTSTNAVNVTLYQHLSFNFMRDVVPVASIDQTPYVFEANLSMPVKTLPEFIAYAKANPGKINMASNGIGSGPHVAGELFKMMAGLDLVHVPYTGNVYPDLIGGQVQVMFSPIPASIGFVRAGQLRPLVVGTAKRLAILPDVPTVAESVPGYEASGWHGISAPANTPADVVEKLNASVNALLADPKFKERLADLGGLQMALSPAEFGKFTADEIDKWAKVIKFADIRSE